MLETIIVSMCAGFVGGMLPKAWSAVRSWMRGPVRFQSGTGTSRFSVNASGVAISRAKVEQFEAT